MANVLRRLRLRASGGAGPPPTPGVLAAADFTLAGYYTYGNSLHEGMNFSGQLTHRYVGGQRRFLATGFNNNVNDLVEFTLPAGAADGRLIDAACRTNSWAGTDVWQTFNPIYAETGEAGKTLIGHHHGIWWEDLGGGAGRLWGSMGVDYSGSGNPYSDITRSMTVRDLNDDGTVSNYGGPWGFEGVSQRDVMGRVQKVPAWAQSAYGLPPYLYGCGGYTSILSAGGTGSLGLFLAGSRDVSGDALNPFPYLTDMADDWTTPTSDFTILADHRSGVTNTDFSGATPPAWDRGYTLAIKKNFFDDAANTPANGTLSIDDVRAFYDSHGVSGTATWVNPGPEGHGRFDWGDSYFASGCVIDGPSKQGYICVASINEVWGGYINSVIGGKQGGAEIHAFDFADLGAVMLGTKQPWNVQPAAMKSITADIAGLGLTMNPRGNEFGGPVGATFDLADKTLWIALTAVDGNTLNALLKIDVDC